MRYVILLFLTLLYSKSIAQQLPDYGLNKVRITQQDKTIVAGIESTSSNPRAKISLFYYWYSANSIHITQGGYSGKLLDGPYAEYFPDKNLKEQGNFKSGLKDGIWKSWNPDGSLMAEVKWKRGAELIVHKLPIWKRVHLFRKKPIVIDTPVAATKTPVIAPPKATH